MWEKADLAESPLQHILGRKRRAGTNPALLDERRRCLITVSHSIPPTGVVSPLLWRCPSPSRWHWRAGREVTACPGAGTGRSDADGVHSYSQWTLNVVCVLLSPPSPCPILPTPLSMPCIAALPTQLRSHKTNPPVLLTSHPCSNLAVCTPSPQCQGQPDAVSGTTPGTNRPHREGSSQPGCVCGHPMT